MSVFATLSVPPAQSVKAHWGRQSCLSTKEETYCIFANQHSAPARLPCGQSSLGILFMFEKLVSLWQYWQLCFFGLVWLGLLLVAV